MAAPRPPPATNFTTTHRTTRRPPRAHKRVRHAHSHLSTSSGSASARRFIPTEFFDKPLNELLHLLHTMVNKKNKVMLPSSTAAIVDSPAANTQSSHTSTIVPTAPLTKPRS